MTITEDGPSKIPYSYYGSEVSMYMLIIGRSNASFCIASSVVGSKDLNDGFMLRYGHRRSPLLVSLSNFHGPSESPPTLNCDQPYLGSREEHNPGVEEHMAIRL